MLIWGTKDKEERCLCGGFTSADRIPPKPGRAVCPLALGLRTQFAASRVWGWARPEGRPEQQKPFQTPLRSLLIFFKHADGHWGTVKNTVFAFLCPAVARASCLLGSSCGHGRDSASGPLVGITMPQMCRARRARGPGPRHPPCTPRGSCRCTQAGTAHASLGSPASLLGPSSL